MFYLRVKSRPDWQRGRGHCRVEDDAFGPPHGDGVDHERVRPGRVNRGPDRGGVGSGVVDRPEVGPDALDRTTDLLVLGPLLRVLLWVWVDGGGGQQRRVRDQRRVGPDALVVHAEQVGWATKVSEARKERVG